MATLRSAEHSFTPPDRCLVGRSRRCDLVLTARDVSSEHAILEWSATHWQVRDLGSRNGTFVDDARVTPGARTPLVAGASLRFGAGPAWLLVDADPPCALAVALADGARRLADAGYLALPGPDDPALAVYQDADGRWLLDQDGAVRPLDDREVVDAGGLWRVHLPSAAAGTEEAGLVLTSRLRLRFAVSRDEETVALLALAGERRIDLQVRAHHYPLLLLARRRLADRAAGLRPDDQGWLRMDDLLAMLRTKEDHLGVAIHRARAQLARAGVADAAALVERRPGARMLRIGVTDIELASLD